MSTAYRSAVSLQLSCRFLPLSSGSRKPENSTNEEKIKIELKEVD